MTKPQADLGFYLVVRGGQGRDRTVDLLLFRERHLPRSANRPGAVMRPACYYVSS